MAVIVYNPQYRNSGRTKFTIDSVVEAILDGQPYCQVVARYHSQLDNFLMQRTIRAIEATGIKPKRLRQYEYNCDGTLLTFHTADTIDMYNRGSPQGRFNCQFWDHSALPIHEQGLL